MEPKGSMAMEIELVEPKPSAPPGMFDEIYNYRSSSAAGESQAPAEDGWETQTPSSKKKGKGKERERKGSVSAAAFEAQAQPPPSSTTTNSMGAAWQAWGNPPSKPAPAPVPAEEKHVRWTSSGGGGNEDKFGIPPEMMAYMDSSSSSLSSSAAIRSRTNSFGADYPSGKAGKAGKSSKRPDPNAEVDFEVIAKNALESLRKAGR
jgi:hypothetical protein